MVAHFLRRNGEPKIIYVLKIIGLTILGLIGAVALAFILHLFIVYIEPLANIFELAPMDFFQWILVFGVVIIATVMLDVIKLLQTRVMNRSWYYLLFLSSFCLEKIVPKSIWWTLFIEKISIYRSHYSILFIITISCGIISNVNL